MVLQTPFGSIGFDLRRAIHRDPAYLGPTPEWGRSSPRIHPPYEPAGPGRLDLGGQRCDVVRPVMAELVDEEGRRPGDAGEIGRVDVLRDPRRTRARAQVVFEALDVEAELPGVADQVGNAQRVLVVEQDVVHLPEGVLLCRRLRRFGRLLRVRMHVV